jgi:hypothetical protein
MYDLILSWNKFILFEWGKKKTFNFGSELFQTKEPQVQQYHINNVYVRHSRKRSSSDLNIYLNTKEWLDLSNN